MPRAAVQAVRAAARVWVPAHLEPALWALVPVPVREPVQALALEPAQQAQALAAQDPPVPVPVLVDRQHDACMQGLNGPVYAPGPYSCMHARAQNATRCAALRPPHQKTDSPVRSVSSSSARLPRATSGLQPLIRICIQSYN